MLPELAFDHEAIIAVALVALRTRVDERNRADD
jgi:hypothetical protein